MTGLRARLLAAPSVALFVALLGLGACGGAANEKPAGATRPASASAGPTWAQAGDRTSAEGSIFVCEGEGPTEEAALAAAQAICNDKVCKLCGVEVESVVQTTETLKGVSMQRKVVERCRRFRKGEPKVRQKTTDCGAQGCATWLSMQVSRRTRRTNARPIPPSTSPIRPSASASSTPFARRGAAARLRSASGRSGWTTRSPPARTSTCAPPPWWTRSSRS